MERNTSLDQAIKLEILGEIYYLTLLKETDCADLHAILSQPPVSDNLLRIPKPYPIEENRTWVQNRCASNAHLMSIPTLSERTATFFTQTHAIPLQCIRASTPTGRYVGCISLTPRASKSGFVELGYYLDPEHQGKRIMVAVAKAALAWAKSEFGVEKVYGSADCVNLRSERVMERVAAETGGGSVVRGTTVLRWPVEKVVVGREVESLSRTWEWSV